MDWQIYGQDWAVGLLHAHADPARLRHAYLLVGPEGVGRRTLALRFAQALNCTRAEIPGDFCGECRECRQIAAMAHPDLSLLQPEEGHKDILVDQVRALQHTLSLTPYTGRYRIALLPDFQRANEQASNALLKTLEEPPEKVVLLLTADALENLLPTIISRCEVVRLRPAAIADAQDYLQSSRGLAPEKARLLAHLTSGRIGAAIRLAEDPEALSRREDQLTTLLALLTASRVERFRTVDGLTRSYDKARTNANDVLPVWLSFWRDVFVTASGADLPLANADRETQVQRVAAKLTPQEARALVIAHEDALQQLDVYANVRLLLEALMLKWPFLSPTLFRY